MVTQTYDDRSLPNTVEGTTVGDLVISTTYTRLGQIKSITQPNSVTTSYDYWRLDQPGGYFGHLYQIQVSAGASSLLELNYNEWDSVGNLKQLYRWQTGIGAETEQFNYDTLDRLTGVTNAYSLSLDYTNIGNIDYNDGKDYQYNSAKPHAVTDVASSDYVYDLNGNMINRGNQIISWDMENRPIAIIDMLDINTYVYDGYGDRVKKTENGETIIYINDYYEKNLTTGEVTTYYYLGGQLVAQNNNNGIRYIFQDHLGSIVLTTTATGSDPKFISYYPFGEIRNATGTPDTDRLFTGQILDATGLYFYNARYYDPEIGRFISADTFIPYPDDPQSFNRYSYCRNNPLNRIDPTGNFDIREDFLYQIADFTAAFGDTITFGGTRWFREEVTNCRTVDYESGSYLAGSIAGEVYATVASFYIPGAAVSQIGRTAVGQAIGRGGQAIARLARTGASAIKDSRLAQVVGQEGGHLGRILRPSIVSSDWAMKGAHATIRGVEMAFKPGPGGKIVIKSVNRVKNAKQLDVARKAAETALNNPVFRKDLYNASGRAIQLLKHGDTLARSRAGELRFLQHALKKMGF